MNELIKLGAVAKAVNAPFIKGRGGTTINYNIILTSVVSQRLKHWQLKCPNLLFFHAVIMRLKFKAIQV